jgi:branched-chain amino acid aminotransferase
MLDASGHVCEGSGQNLFIVNGKTLRTPPPYAGILLGVTRNAVMEIATQAGYTVQETLFNRYDIYTADEAFLTGTASEVAPIRSLDGRAIGTGKPGPVTRDLMTKFRALVRD